MKLEQVVELYQSFEAAQLQVWVDGGWGVDALLGEQTRPHSDLDLALKFGELPSCENILKSHGYVEAERDGEPEWNRVFRQPSGWQVDLHGFVLDVAGNAVLGDPAQGIMYPVGALDGAGTLGELRVRCVAAPFVLQFRNSFEPRSVDHHDVARLCARFDLPLPCRFRPHGS
ncbi:aminoglycoside nucleotidyltransferase (plasmid) [Deinococcus aetherius]|uniref:Aminoglycoside nucleotidyltransferase n=1 Tax=Deinococcus aetherius TaxID=200252 RepID=A0ABN6RMC1_9DEIO|nr:hypothetical protein [Deinococcus aetherius]BDP43908.1 aminoglycoside nucleotidyltransferase [Deinococcus aetherius]